MPIYVYRCDDCQAQTIARRPVEGRDWPAPCPSCHPQLMRRVFTPTANIEVPEHFRHLQSDFLPDKEDKAAWANRGSKEWDSQRHDEPEGPTLKEHLEQDLELTRERIKITRHLPPG